VSIFNRSPRTGGHLVATANIRDQVLDTYVKLGVDLNPHHTDALTAADLVRLAYREGVRATEQRLMSPDVADAIAVAIEYPEKVVTEPGYISGTGKVRWQVAAVQQAAVYGVPK
jgi:hypothetical protein